MAFADARIAEAHADTSSGAAEGYAAGNATLEFLHLTYAMYEMGLEFSSPFTLQIDNAAAIVYAKGTANYSKLKHIDARQSWVSDHSSRPQCVCPAPCRYRVESGRFVHQVVV